MMIYRCGIIGLGRQGAGIPEPYPVDKPRSHKEAYEIHPRCKLLWGTDTVAQRDFGNLGEADIVSICSPAETHWAQVLWAIDFHKAKAVFCEKPLAPTLQECDEIISLCEQAQVVLAVNHQRAWELHGRVVWNGDPLEVGTHAAELAHRLGMELALKGVSVRPSNKNFIDIECRGFGPGVSPRAIDDIINCIEHGGKPKCNGKDGRRAVALALAVGFEGGTSGGETRGRSEVLAEAERVSPAV